MNQFHYRFAIGTHRSGDWALERCTPDNTTGTPSLLVSFIVLRHFLRNRRKWHFTEWVLDSGAFSAFNSGVPIRLNDYIECCKRLLDYECPPAEIYSLDVIEDWKATIKNTDKLWALGIPAIPTFHANEPEDVLKGLARDYPKIAVGGMAKFPGARKVKFAQQCFNRVWPALIHGFGVGDQEVVKALPWHSVDATTWQVCPCSFGSWQAFGSATLKSRGGLQNLLPQIEWYLRLERWARARWKQELNSLPEYHFRTDSRRSCSAPMPDPSSETPKPSIIAATASVA